VEPLSARLVEAADGQPFVQQRAVDEAGVHVEEEFRVERVVRETRHGVDPLHPRVDVVDAFCRRAGLSLRPEGQRVREQQRPLQPAPGVALVEARLARSGDHEWVGRLQQQRSRPAEQHGNLSVDAPGDAVRAEVADVGGHAVRVSGACVERRRGQLTGTTDR
jgi:hypothetical protein